MYQEYKGHRAETKPELGQQFGTMQRVLDQIKIPQFKIENFEAL